MYNPQHTAVEYKKKWAQLVNTMLTVNYKEMEIILLGYLLIKGCASMWAKEPTVESTEAPNERQPPARHTSAAAAPFLLPSPVFLSSPPPLHASSLPETPKLQGKKGFQALGQKKKCA